MAKKNQDFWNKIGVWAFLAGVAVSLLVAFFTTQLEIWSVGVLIIFGLIVGLINVADSEVQLYLLGSIGFLLSAQIITGVFSSFGSTFQPFIVLLQALSYFIAPGALIVSCKALYQVAKDE